MVLAGPLAHAANPPILGGPPPAASAAPPDSDDAHFGNLPEIFADVRKDGADVYDSVAAIRAGTPTSHVGDKTFVAIRRNAKILAINGIKYSKTDQGWIARTSLSWYSPSTFQGERITSNVLPAWAYSHRIGGTLTLRSEPNRKAPALGTLLNREVIIVLEVRDGFARLQHATGVAQWLDVRDVKQVVAVPRPVGITADERWLDIDLNRQILVSYQGDAPVFATLIASGKKKWGTPTGVYRIVDKRERARMQADGATEQWNVAAVPWTMTFRKNFALHGTYWHDGFGRARSHGCINLAPADAHRIFEFVAAATPLPAPKRKSSAKHKVALATSVPTEAALLVVVGTAVQLRRDKEQTPAWRDYQGAIMPVAPETAAP